MDIKAQAFSMVKKGNASEEYADAFYLPKSRKDRSFHGSGERFLFAIADGATEAAFSDIWAKLLVSSYGKGQLSPCNFQDIISKLKVIWETVVNGMNLPWYSKEKIRQGSASTFLGVTFKDNGMGDTRYGLWETMYVGDSCIFQVRDGSLIKHYPISHSDKFNSTPNLVYTVPDLNKEITNLVETKNRIWHKGDIFYLMTDSLSFWFLKEVEMGRSPWFILDALGNGGGIHDFTEFINDLIDSDSMRNDDATLLRIEII